MQELKKNYEEFYNTARESLLSYARSFSSWEEYKKNIYHNLQRKF